jgi:hypothetical protein
LPLQYLHSIQAVHRNFSLRSTHAWYFSMRDITHAHFFVAKSCDELFAAH